MKISTALIATFATIGAIPFQALAQPMMPSDMAPPNAHPGQCFARVLVPATYVPDQNMSVPDTIASSGLIALSRPYSRTFKAAGIYCGRFLEVLDILYAQTYT